MANSNSEAFKYSIIDNIDYVFEELGNQFGAIRKIQWGDNDKQFYEVRRWFNSPDGVEKAAKGYTFLTEEGPDELTKGLLELGFGNTREVLNILNNRPDFRKSLNSVLGNEDALFDQDAGTLEDDYFDPKSFLGD